MNNEAHRKYHHAKSRLIDAQEGLEDMRRGGANERRLVRYWREFLTNCVACQKSLQKCLMLAGNSRLSDEIWSSCKESPEIHYMYQSRNSETHSELAAQGEITSVKLSGGSTSINLGFADGAGIVFRRNVVIDENGNTAALPDLYGKVRDGNFEGFSKGRGTVSVRGPYVTMLSASSGGQIFQVPSSAKNMPETAYLRFAQQYCDFLSGWERAVRDALKLS